MDNQTSPAEEVEQPTADSTVQTEQPTKESQSNEGQEVKEIIPTPTLPDDLPVESKEYVNLAIQQAKREMQSAFTKKTQELAKLRKELENKATGFDQIKEY
jgi:hypothetical protein